MIRGYFKENGTANFIHIDNKIRQDKKIKLGY